MGKYQIYIYFALTAIVTATIAATLWNLFLPTERIRRLHTRKMWTVGLFFAGLTLFVSGLFVYWIVGQYKQPAAIVQGLGIGLIMTVILLGTYEASDMFRGQGLFFGSTSVIASVAALAIVVAANFYTSKNPAQYDFNADKLETLNDQTLNVLKALEKPVEVVAFLYKQEKQIAQRLRTFFKKYSDINPKKFQVRIIDPVENPSTAACYGVKGSAGSQLRNRVVLSIKGKCLQKKNRTVFSNKKIVVEKLSEQEITNKLIKLTRKRQKKVCFLRGRGQPSIEESKSRYGYNEFKKQLIEKGFSTQEVNLLTSENVPKACDIVVQAVPEWTLLLRRSGKLGLSSGAKLDSFEVAKLERYLAAGGKMMIFQEPLVQSGLEGLLKKYGIVSRSGATVDFLYNHRGLPFRPMGTDFSTSHPIVKGFYRRARMPFEWATSFQRAKAVPAGVTATELIKTTKVRIGVPGGRVSAAKCCSFYIPTPLSRGFGKLMNDSRRWKRNEMLLQILRNQIVKKLIPNSEVGPHTLAMAAVKKGSKAKSQTQIVAFGDSALASNFLMQVPEVRTVIFNSIAWLAKEKDLVHIVTKRRKPSNINISATQKKALQLVSQWGSGLFFFIMVLMVWGMRRQQ